MTRLTDTALERLRKDVACATFGYDRDAQKVGIVHFGIGAFHRAHQAWYTDRAMDAGERDWAIAGISLRSPSVMAQLDPQGGLYTLTERSGARADVRLIGSVREVLVADRHPKSIVDRIAAPECHIVAFTVTEKGYCRAVDDTLDLPRAERGFYPFLVDALARRRDRGLPGVTLLSCDNLADNGRQLERLLGSFIAAKRSDLAGWFSKECTCPGTMVDRIVPATAAADLDWIEVTLGGIRDEGAVFTECFSQWVIEDRFAGSRPGWHRHGAQLVADVAPYETAKLRMLNGAHSALAYLGLERRHEYVHQAVADPRLHPLVARLVRVEAASSFTPAPDQDLAAYADALFVRFADPALNHRLAQIAMDGSQKIPQRWLETLAVHQRSGEACPALLHAVAAWMRHVRGDMRPVDDPLAESLADLWRESGSANIAAALFGERGVFAQHWRAEPGDLDFLTVLLGERP